jgi:hypothetical protein
MSKYTNRSSTALACKPSDVDEEGSKKSDKAIDDPFIDALATEVRNE